MSKKPFETSFPEFPNDIIQGVAKQFVDLYSPIRETPEPFLWLAFLTYLGNAISPYVRLDSASSEPRFYGVVIGKSGRTRKSAGNNAARDLFRLVAPKNQQVIEGYGSTEGLLRRLGACDSPKPTLLHFDEMNILASKTEISGSAGIAPLHVLFEGHEYEAPLAQGGYCVKNAYLSFVGASTFEDFTEMWNSKHANAGFFSRLLLVAGDTDKSIPRPTDPDPGVLAGLVQKIKWLLESVIATPRTLRMDSEAETVWGKFYETFGDGPEWNRIDTYGFRLMVLQAVLRSEDSVTKENVQQVVEVLQYEVAIRRAVSPVIAENQLAQMEETIRRKLPEGKTITKRDLEHHTNAHRFGIDLFRRAIVNMSANGELTVEQKGKSYRYTRVSSAEDDEADSQTVVGDVVDSSEDTSHTENPNGIAATTKVDGDCLQYSAGAQPERNM